MCNNYGLLQLWVRNNYGLLQANFQDVMQAMMTWAVTTIVTNFTFNFHNVEMNCYFDHAYVLSL